MPVCLHVSEAAAAATTTTTTTTTTAAAATTTTTTATTTTTTITTTTAATTTTTTITTTTTTAATTTTTRFLVRSPTWGLIVVRKFLTFMKPNFEFSFPLGYDTALLIIGSRRFEGTASLQNVGNQLSRDAVPYARKL